MKNYEQMAADVLRRRDEAVAEVAEKRKTTRRVAMIAAAGYFQYQIGNFADTSLNASANDDGN